MDKEKAIEVVKKNYPHVNESGNQFETTPRTLIPELAESKDEKIRQFLIHEVTETSDEIMSYRNMNKKDVLAWLEKQGEQKPAWSEEDEKMFRGAITICDIWSTKLSCYPKENDDMEKLKNWLKSLKERLQLK